jgi:hypothetical protein
MKASDPLAKLLKAAARAERMAAPEPAALPFGLETRVLAALRNATEPFPFLPLFRRALAFAAAIALLSGSLVLQRSDNAPDPYEFTVNYSLATAYLQ